jgi:hypothetical protein
MKKIILTLFIIGIILLCAFAAPITHKTWEDRDDVAQTYTVYSNIFNTQGQLNIGRFFLFLIIWSVVCYALYALIKEFKSNQSSFN